MAQEFNVAVIDFINRYEQFESFLLELQLNNLPDVILIELDKEDRYLATLQHIQKSILLRGIIIILIGNKDLHRFSEAKKLKVHDIYFTPLNYDYLKERIQFLVRFKLIKPRIEELGNEVETFYKIPIGKRFFDILFSGSIIIISLPLLVIIALILKIGSKGPIIYKSKRVGTGYKIFAFYKFRSMRIDADKQIENLSQLNQYTGVEGQQKSTFIKFKNDPRVTKFGQFIRKTSIDELPQLFNILKGDMSVVGNRPLPLYEAEMLTSNEWALRFLAPAGLTGLWQISKRGRKDMSERERKKLDNFYALKYSLWFDIKILLKTIPAVFQKEKV